VPLTPIAGPAYFMPGRVNIGVIMGQNEAAFIDTGLDESGARKAINAIEQAGARVVAILNTHAHADHCGGNAFVRRRTGAAIYAPAVEGSLIEHPEIEPWYLYGAAPFPAIDTKWFHAEPSPVDHVLVDSVQLCGIALQIMPTPGHSIGQVAVLTPEVAFLGDALVAPEILERYPIQYVYDVMAHRETLKHLISLQQPWFIGAHFPPTCDLEGILAANNRNLERTAQAVWDAIESPGSIEEIVARTAEMLGVFSMDASAYFLNAAAIKAHLSAHAHAGRAGFEIQDRRPIWRRID